MGKLIVAISEAEEPELERLLDLGRENGVEGLRFLTAGELHRMEPHVKATAALYSSCTAVLDAEGAACAYARLATDRSAQILTGAPVDRLTKKEGAWLVEVSAGQREGWAHRSRWVVNAAGLYSDRIAALAGLDIGAEGLHLHWVKGNYFSLPPARQGLVQHLIYPVPPANGSSLGIHLCLDLGGQIRLGPDMEPVSPVEDFRVDPERGRQFFESASGFLPFLTEEELTPAMAGIRPKLAADRFADFVVRQEVGDLEGLINLIGIDSPGLTSSPALAEAVAELIAQ
jgi:L-2-hydroxyglutarate oxidase LhgO